MVSDTSNKIHQTLGPLFWLTLLFRLNWKISSRNIWLKALNPRQAAAKNGKKKKRRGDDDDDSFIDDESEDEPEDISGDEESEEDWAPSEDSD